MKRCKTSVWGLNPEQFVSDDEIAEWVMRDEALAVAEISQSGTLIGQALGEETVEQFQPCYGGGQHEYDLLVLSGWKSLCQHDPELFAAVIHEATMMSVLRSAKNG